jgi:hypothetical protein
MERANAATSMPAEPAIGNSGEKTEAILLILTETTGFRSKSDIVNQATSQPTKTRQSGHVLGLPRHDLSHFLRRSPTLHARAEFGDGADEVTRMRSFRLDPRVDDQPQGRKILKREDPEIPPKDGYTFAD